jgi:hypothetical protein
MFKVETSTLEGCFAADPGREADLRAGEWRAGTVGHRRVRRFLTLGRTRILVVALGRTRRYSTAADNPRNPLGACTARWPINAGRAHVVPTCLPDVARRGCGEVRPWWSPGPRRG